MTLRRYLASTTLRTHSHLSACQDLQSVHGLTHLLTLQSLCALTVAAACPCIATMTPFRIETARVESNRTAFPLQVLGESQLPLYIATERVNVSRYEPLIEAYPGDAVFLQEVLDDVLPGTPAIFLGPLEQVTFGIKGENSRPRPEQRQADAGVSAALATCRCPPDPLTCTC